MRVPLSENDASPGIPLLPFVVGGALASGFSRSWPERSASACRVPVVPLRFTTG